ncbi:MAG TPA: hypothetical protein VJH97_02815 [Candidatus Nanoarchaeia archaeon]|nr:hypothetical protein [Candidatus Nanoarchaeia archaeon]
MVYIRIKKIKKKSGNCYEYAYLVENTWKKRKQGARQKVKAFLGRVHKPVISNDVDFLQHHSIMDINQYVKENGLGKITRDLITWELHKHDLQNDISIDFENRVVRRYKNKAVVQMNEGFLCDYTLKKLLGFRFKDDENAGITLAKAFVEAGIKIPEELFIKVFEKIS